MTTNSMPRITVLVVDDEPDLRTLISRRLERTGDLAVIGEAGDAATAVELAAAQQPDVVLLDLLLGADRGDEAMGPLLRAAPAAMVAVLTVLPAEHEEEQLRAAGAFVYYEKTMLVDLAAYIRHDLATFQRALRDEPVIAPAAVTRRP